MKHPRGFRGIVLLPLALAAALRAAAQQEAKEEPPPATPEKVELDLEARAVDPPSFPKLVWLDIGHVVSRPFHWEGEQWLVFGGTLLVTGALIPVDETVSDALYDEDAPSFGTVGHAFGFMGDARSVVLTGGLIAYGALAKDQRAKEAGIDALLAGAIGAGLVNTTLATFVGRERPNRGQGATSFEPGFHTHPGYRSFPSGHVAHAFAVATALSTSYDSAWVTAAAYLGATLTAYDRLRLGKHFLSDTVAGAALGSAVGYTVVRFNRRLRHGGDADAAPPVKKARVAVVPVLGDGTYGLFATVRF